MFEKLKSVLVTTRLTRFYVNFDRVRFLLFVCLIFDQISGKRIILVERNLADGQKALSDT